MNLHGGYILLILYRQNHSIQLDPGSLEALEALANSSSQAENITRGSRHSRPLAPIGSPHGFCMHYNLPIFLPGLHFEGFFPGLTDLLGVFYSEERRITCEIQRNLYMHAYMHVD